MTAEFMRMVSNSYGLSKPPYWQLMWNMFTHSAQNGLTYYKLPCYLTQSERDWLTSNGYTFEEQNQGMIGSTIIRW